MQNDYLDAVFDLSDGGDPVRLTDLAARMNVTKASASRAVSALSEAGLVEHKRYGTLFLTPEGAAIVSETRQRCDLVKNFIAERLGVSEKCAAANARAFVRVADGEFIAALNAAQKE